MQHAASNMAAPLPGRCAFFVEKKKRFCKMIVGKGKKFCGEHADMSVDGSRRIVCPLDPKHTVSENKLENHLKKCNSREKDKPVYYVENINAGSSGGAEPQDRTELQSLVDQLKAAVTGLDCNVEDGVLSHPVLQVELSNPKNGDSAHKHLKQQSSILGHLQDLGLLEGGRCFVEFGAGRGKLSHWIHEALKTSQDLQLLLVERCSTRFKVDGKHQDVGVEFERLQVDIQHLDLSKVPLLQTKKLPLVGVGKHLCGAATDLALRCLLERPGHEEESEPRHKRMRTMDPGCGSVLGLAVALCCHHRCEWRHYVGQEFFLKQGLGEMEFSAFCRMSSWATCGLRLTNQDEGHEGSDLVRSFLCRFLSAAEREQMGRRCKELIDAGRLHFLKTKGFEGKLRRYADPQVTLENVLLTAVAASP
uniref:tRNA:m(4)X modification enzyme TRM13 n=1 Tax=Cynoglossus semilaevis TaxID=244447 RepID=A0A3P8UKQ9_CYNSE